MSRWDGIDLLPAVRQARHESRAGRPLVAMARTFPAGTRIGAQAASRGQLLLVASGLLVASTDTGTWMVPGGHALWLSAGTLHELAMHGDVVMNTVHVSAAAIRAPAPGCRVIVVTQLLDAAIAALCREAPLDDESGRGGHLAALVLDEIARAEIAPFVLPIPADRRLAALARALIREPGLARNLDDWCLLLAMSRRSLTRLFRLETGLSIGVWQRRLRLLEATARTASGEATARVAAALGYRSLSAFKAMTRREAARGAGPPPSPEKRGHSSCSPSGATWQFLQKSHAGSR